MVAYKRGSNIRDVLVHRKTQKAMFGGEGRGREDCKKNCVVVKELTEGRAKKRSRDPMVNLPMTGPLNVAVATLSMGSGALNASRFVT